MSTPRPFSGYVLAGGASRRLGRDKAALPWPNTASGLTLLERMIKILTSVCPRVCVIRGENPGTGGGLPDRIPGLGPLGGVSTALHDSGTAENIIVAVDLPLLTTDFVKYFKQRTQASKRQLTACKIGSAFPLCLAIPTDFAPQLDAYLATGKRSVHGLIESASTELITETELAEAGIPRSIFMNINTIADYEAALRTITP